MNASEIYPTNVFHILLYPWQTLPQITDERELPYTLTLTHIHFSLTPYIIHPTEAPTRIHKLTVTPSIESLKQVEQAPSEVEKVIGATGALRFGDLQHAACGHRAGHLRPRVEVGNRNGSFLRILKDRERLRRYTCMYVCMYVFASSVVQLVSILIVLMTTWI